MLAWEDTGSPWLTIGVWHTGDHVLAPGWQSYKHRYCRRRFFLRGHVRLTNPNPPLNRLHYQTFDVTALLKTGK
jgi:hypothetical protein